MTIEYFDPTREQARIAEKRNRMLEKDLAELVARAEQLKDRYNLGEPRRFGGLMLGVSKPNEVGGKSPIVALPIIVDKNQAGGDVSCWLTIINEDPVHLFYFAGGAAKNGSILQTRPSLKSPQVTITNVGMGGKGLKYLSTSEVARGFVKPLQIPHTQIYLICAYKIPKLCKRRYLPYFQ